MFYSAIAVLGVLTVNTFSAETIAYSKNRRHLSSRRYFNPIKELYKNIDDIWKDIKHLKGRNLTNIDYSEISAPPQYDYPEIWWTEQPLTTTTKSHIKNKDIERSKITNLGETLKPTVIKKKIKVVNNLNTLRVRKKKNSNVTATLKRIVNKNKTTTKKTQVKERPDQYYYIVNKDDKKGDISLQVNRDNIIIESRQNKTNPGVHASVVAGLLIKNDTALSDFDYVIYDKSHPDPYGQQIDADYIFNDTEPVKNAKPTIIKILKENEGDETLKQLNAGVPLLLGPKNSYIMPSAYEREGIDDTNVPLAQMGTTNKTENTTNIFSNQTLESNTNIDMNEQFNVERNNERNKVAGFKEGIKLNTSHGEKLDTINGFPNFAKDVGFGEHHSKGMFTPNDDVEKSTDPGEKSVSYNVKQTEETQNSVKRELSKSENVQTAKTDNTPSFIEDPDAFLPTVTQTDFDDMPKKNDDVTETTPTLSMFEFTPEIPVGVNTRPGGTGPSGTRTFETKPPPSPPPFSPFVHSLVDKMASLKMGCFSVSLLGLFEMMGLKTPRDAGVLLKNYRREVDSMLNVDHIFYLGRPWVEGLERLADYLSRAPIDVIQSQSKLLYRLMLDRNVAITKDINSVIDYIDTLYTQDECIKLLRVLDKFHDFPNTTETVRELHRALTDAAYYPMIRLRGTTKRQILIDSITTLIYNHEKGPHIDRRHVQRTNAKRITSSLYKPVTKSSDKKNIRKAIHRTYVKRKKANRSRTDRDASSDEFNIDLNTHKVIFETNGKTEELNKRFSKIVDDNSGGYKHLDNCKTTYNFDIIDDAATNSKLKRRTTKRLKHQKDRNVLLSPATITISYSHQNAILSRNKPISDINTNSKANANKIGKSNRKGVSDKHKNTQKHIRTVGNEKKVVKLQLDQPKLYEMYTKHYKHHDRILSSLSISDLAKLDEVLNKYKDIENQYRKLVKLYEEKFNVSNTINSNNDLAVSK